LSPRSSSSWSSEARRAERRRAAHATCTREASLRRRHRRAALGRCSRSCAPRHAQQSSGQGRRGDGKRVSLLRRARCGGRASGAALPSEGNDGQVDLAHPQELPGRRRAALRPVCEQEAAGRAHRSPCAESGATRRAQAHRSAGSERAPAHAVYTRMFSHTLPDNREYRRRRARRMHAARPPADRRAATNIGQCASTHNVTHHAHRTLSGMRACVNRHISQRSARSPTRDRTDL